MLKLFLSPRYMIFVKDQILPFQFHNIFLTNFNFIADVP